MKTLLIIAACLALLTGCAIVPAQAVHQACLSLSEAWSEAKMPEGWYERTDIVLKQCAGYDHQ